MISAPTVDIRTDFADYLARGLARVAVKSCSKWAERYRVIKGKPWRHREWAWTREIEDAQSRLVIGQKAAQVGYTEVALNKTFYTLDILKYDCLYVLPSKGDASDFSAGRFDPALEDSEYLRKLFSDVNNVGLKRAGSAVLYVRGGKGRSGLKSIPTAFIVLDEINEMPPSNIPLVLERFSGQEWKQAMMLSTPDAPGRGINKYYNESTMERFFFPCIFCGRQIEWKFPESIVITAEEVTDTKIKNTHYICSECKHPYNQHEKIDATSKGKFVAEFPDRDNRGFQVNQMYSPRVEAWEFATSYLKSLYDPTEEQEFYNSKLGQVHLVGDARVKDVNIDACKKYGTQYILPGPFKSQVITMGIDAGAYWHIVIDEWHQIGISGRSLTMSDLFYPRMMVEMKIPLMEGLKKIPELMRKYQVKGCVIDRHPETFVVNQITGRFPDRAFACVFGKSVNGRTMSRNDEERMLTVDRTTWFDAALGRIIGHRMHLPLNTSLEFCEHIKVPAKIYQKDADGNPVSRWVSEKNHDHFALSRVYSEIALPIALENIDPGPLGKV